jgi:pimeloyl-ACP methyl ester carboxylesterase
MERKEIVLAGGTFSYIEAGAESAPLVVCSHGFPDVPSTFADLMARLAAWGYRAVAPWLRGYDPSPLVGPYHPDRIADDLIELADALCPDERVIFIGHDWGAVSTYIAAARYPHRIARAIAMAVPHPVALTKNLTRVDGQLRRSWYMGLFQLPLVAELVVRRRDFAFVDRLFSDWSPGFDAPADHVREVKDCLARSMPAPIQYYRDVRRRERGAVRTSPDRTPRISVPTLHLHGARDGCIGYGAGRGQERLFSGPFKSDLLSGVGHFLHLEDPVRVADRIHSWLSAGPTSGLAHG